MKNIKFLIIVFILAGASYISIKSYLPARVDAGLNIQVSNFPMTVGDWTATEVELSERDYEILETRNLFVRDYANSAGESVGLYMVYSEDNRKVSHPPEICLIGSGLTVTKKSVFQVSDSIKAVKLLIEKGDSRELVVYWYKAGDIYTDKYLKQQLKIVMDRMLGKRTSGALIRLSAIIKNDNEEAALNLVKGFCAEIAPLLPQYIP